MTNPIDTSVPIPPAPTFDVPAVERIRNLARELPEARLLGRGYDKIATDALIEQVCATVEYLSGLVRAMKVENESVWAELTARREGLLTDNLATGPLSDLLLKAQLSAMEQGDEVIRLSTEQSAQIVAAAHEQAAQVMSAAHAEADQIRSGGRSQTIGGDRSEETRRMAEALVDYVARSAQVLNDAHLRFSEELERLNAPRPVYPPGG